MDYLTVVVWYSDRCASWIMDGDVVAGVAVCFVVEVVVMEATMAARQVSSDVLSLGSFSCPSQSLSITLQRAQMASVVLVVSSFML